MNVPGFFSRTLCVCCHLAPFLRSRLSNTQVLWCTLKPSYYSGIRNPGRLTTSTPHHGGDPGSIALRRALFCKEESRLMSKRLLGSVLFASIVTLLLVAGALAFAGSATQASTLSGPPAASGSNLAPNAVW